MNSYTTKPTKGLFLEFFVDREYMTYINNLCAEASNYKGYTFDTVIHIFQIVLNNTDIQYLLT